MTPRTTARALPRGVALVVVLVGATSCLPPLAHEASVPAGEAARVAWQASGEKEQLWLRVGTTGGRSLRGPIVVTHEQGELARGTFSLQKKGIEESSGTFVVNWTSSSSGAHGHVHVFDLPAVAAGSELTADVALTPGPGTAVEELVVEVRRGNSTKLLWDVLTMALVGFAVAAAVVVVLAFTVITLVKRSRRPAPE